MRALRYYAPKDLRLDTDVPEPECQPHEIKVRPAYIGICGTDLHEYQHAQNLIPLPGKPHPLTGGTPPVVIGHEFSGVVVEVGSGVTKYGNGEGGIKAGDRVAVQPTLYCRECVPCKQGHTNCCTRNGFLGLSGRGGGLADYVCADADAVFKLPDSVPLEVGALVEPLTVAWHAISISNIKPGDKVLVLGTGPIGLAVIQCLPSFGAGTIIAAEMAGERQVFAKKYGATHLVDPSKEDVVARCHEIGEGYGVEVAFDCAGVEKSLDAATRAVRAKGTVVNLAIWHGKVGFDPNSLVFHEKNYKGSLCFLPSDFGKVVEAIDKGTIKPQGMITRKIALDRVVEDGFEALIHEKDKHVKIMIDMGIEQK